MDNTVYISVTGLRLKKWWHFFKFVRYTVPVRAQAAASEGNIKTDVTKINGVYHTLTVWEDRDGMMGFMTSGIHQKAIVEFPSFATGKTYGYEVSSSDIPDWPAVIAILDEKGVEY